MRFGCKEIISKDKMNDDHNFKEKDGDEYVDVHVEILNASESEVLENVKRDSKEKVGDDDEITAEELDNPIKLDGDTLDTNEEKVKVDAKKYSKASLEKARKLTEPEINVVNVHFEDVHISNPALEVEILDIKNFIDNVVKIKNQDDKANPDNYEVNGGHKEPAWNEVPRFNHVKELIDDNSVFVARLMHHDVARLEIPKRFPRLLWRPGDPCDPSYSVLKKLTMKFMEKVNKEVFDDNEEEVKKHYENCCCFPNCVLNEHGMTVGTLAMDVELFKESLFPGLLHRAWDELEDYKAGMFDNLPSVKDKLVSDLHATLTDLDQFSISASANTPDYGSI